MFQIRNGPGYTEKMVVASGAETQTGKSIFHHTGGLAGKAAVTVQKRNRKLAVKEKTLTLVPLLLYEAGIGDFFLKLRGGNHIPGERSQVSVADGRNAAPDPGAA